MIVTLLHSSKQNEKIYYKSEKTAVCGLFDCDETLEPANPHNLESAKLFRKY